MLCFYLMKPPYKTVRELLAEGYVLVSKNHPSDGFWRLTKKDPKGRGVHNRCIIDPDYAH
jgi:hypothetical protein